MAAGIFQICAMLDEYALLRPELRRCTVARIRRRRRSRSIG
jgi:hypothetical protein